MRTSHGLRRAGALLAVAAGLSFSAEAAACGVCGSGDRFVAMDAFGAESWRTSAELRLGSTRAGAIGGGTYVLREGQLDLGLGYGFSPSLSASASLPLLLRQVTSPAGRELVMAGPGDAELRLSVLASGLASPRKLFLFLGVKLPTAGVAVDGGGEPLPAAIQPGMGSVAPFVGGAWIGIYGPWIGRVTGALYLPFQVLDGPHGSTTFRAGGSLERRVLPELSTRLGLTTRLEASTDANGVDEPSSGGFVGYVTTEVVLRPRPQAAVTAGLHLPVLQLLRGDHALGTIAALGFAYAL